MKGIIYKATNTFNGKVYIGQTVSGLRNRMAKHLKDAKTDHSNAFHLALYQYPDSFTWDILDEFHGSLEDVIHKLNVAEEYHIIKNGTLDQEKGYNSTGGGYSSDKFADNIIRRAKAMRGQSRAILQYDSEGNFIREYESLYAVAHSLGKAKMQFKVLTNGLHYGFQWREKTCGIYPRKIKPYSMRMRKTRGILVYGYDGKFVGRFDSVADAERFTNMTANVRPSVQDISLRQHNARSYYFFDATDDYPKEINVSVIENEQRENIDQRKRVAAYNLLGNIVGVYDSMSIGHKELGSSLESIRRYCSRKQPIILTANSRGRYVWQLAGENPPHHIEIISMSKKETIRKMEHRIIQYSLDGELIKIWDSAYQASLCNTDSKAYIRLLLNGQTPKKTPKYQWRYYSDDYPMRIEPYNRSTTGASVFTRSDDTIAEIDWRGDTIATYRDSSEAATCTGVSQSYICNVLAGRIRRPKRRFKRIA